MLVDDGAAGPSRRLGHALAYDTAQERLLCFGGGLDETGQLGDVIIWQFVAGAGWSVADVPETSAEGDLIQTRVEFSMAFDEARARLLIVSGFRLDIVNQNPPPSLIEWDGEALSATPLVDVDSVGQPVDRRGAAVAWVPERQELVLFGGYTQPDRSEAVGDTWRFVPGVGEAPAVVMHVDVDAAALERRFVTRVDVEQAAAGPTALLGWSGRGWQPLPQPLVGQASAAPFFVDGDLHVAIAPGDGGGGVGGNGADPAAVDVTDVLVRVRFRVPP